MRKLRIFQNLNGGILKMKSRKDKLQKIFGNQVARLRFGQQYIQLIFYISVIVSAITVVFNDFGFSIGYIDYLVLLLGFGFLTWLSGYLTEKARIVEYDNVKTIEQKYEAQKVVTGKVWKEVIIPELVKQFIDQLKKEMKEDDTD